jgi:N-acyl homoserine lactone hydrolase
MSQIDSVQVASTGSVWIRPEHRRSRRTPMLWWLATSRRWTQRLPINVYVIRRGDEVVLFDAGQDRRSVTDPRYFPRGAAGWPYRRLARFEIGADETLVARLGALGIRPDQVTTVVLSHLHQDHIGGIGELPNATRVVARAEWEAARSPVAAALNGFLSEHLALDDPRWRPIEFERLADDALAPFETGHRLFGDDSTILLPLPGHTPGSMGLLVRPVAGPPLLLVGDLTYDVGLLDREQVPGVGGHGEVLATTRRVNELRRRMPDLVVLAAHDPSAASLLDAAMRDRMGA